MGSWNRVNIKIRGRIQTCPRQEEGLHFPVNPGFEDKELMERWGADAIRDSDGTKLDKDVKSLDAEIYTTYFGKRSQ